MLKRWACTSAIGFLMVTLSGCLFFGHKKSAPIAPTTETEPDKILFERGVAEIEKGHYDVGRLTLQTLINTYPDSEYLAKSKLQIADSFYKEGGTSGLVQAKAEYKDFITFFPNDPDAAEAQMKAAMTHYRQMEKPDRDGSQARDAEEEFKYMLAQYSKSQYAPEAQQKLREVQEVRAEGNYQVGRQYYLRHSYRAAIDRFKESIQKFPDYSGQDKTLYLLGQSYERSNNDRAAADSYAKIVQYFPKSDYFDKAQAHLEEMNLPIPATDLKALALAEQEESNRVHKGLFGRAMGMFRKSPDVSMARTTPSPLPPQGPLTAAKQPTGSEPGTGPEGISAEISVGPVTRTPSTTKPAAAAGSEDPNAPKPTATPNKDTAPPSDSTGSTPQSKGDVGADKNKKDKTSDTSKSSSKKKKKSLRKKILRF